MKNAELDDRMRAFESAVDPCVLPGVFLAARLDGRDFTRLTRELHPFDPRFHELMKPLVAGQGFGEAVNVGRDAENQPVCPRPCGASWSSTTIARGRAVPGTSDQLSEGEMSLPSQVLSQGMVLPSAAVLLQGLHTAIDSNDPGTLLNHLWTVDDTREKR